MIEEDFDDELDGEDEAEVLPEYRIWQRTDSMSNGRWLYVDHPDREGDIEVGIVDVYRKFLTPAEATAMAKALRLAAREGRQAKAAAKAERERQIEAKRRCVEELGGHEWGDWLAGDFACRRCGSGPETVAHVMVFDPEASPGFVRDTP